MPEFQGGRQQHVFPGECSLFLRKSPLENPKVSKFKPELGQVINERASRAANSSLPQQVPAGAAEYWSWNKRCHEGRWVLPQPASEPLCSSRDLVLG